MHGSSARQHENVPDTLLRNEIDDVIGKLQGRKGVEKRKMKSEKRKEKESKVESRRSKAESQP
jgi:hypothetical protein